MQTILQSEDPDATDNNLLLKLLLKSIIRQSINLLTLYFLKRCKIVSFNTRKFDSQWLFVWFPQMVSSWRKYLILFHCIWRHSQGIWVISCYVELHDHSPNCRRYGLFSVWISFFTSCCNKWKIHKNKIAFSQTKCFR